MLHRLSLRVSQIPYLVIIFVLLSGLFVLPYSQAQADFSLEENTQNETVASFKVNVSERGEYDAPMDGPTPVSTSTPSVSIESRAASASLWTMLVLLLLTLLAIIIFAVRWQLASKRKQ